MQHNSTGDATAGVDLSKAAAVGEWYVHSRSAHRDAKVIEAYRQLQSETDRLFTLFTGEAPPWTARVVFTRCSRPYASDTELIRAGRANGTLEITSAATAGERLHPLLGCEFGGAFDRFRAVHDLIGHARCGYGFGLVDECAAWSVQDRLHSGLARRALATELFGVNAARNIVGEPPELRALLLLPSALLRSPQQDTVSDSHRNSRQQEACSFWPSGAATGRSAQFRAGGGPTTMPAAPRSSTPARRRQPRN
jgi:hypothetical protein